MILSYFLLPLVATVVFIIVLYPLSLKIGLTDKPCHRKQHKTPVPLIGGIASYLAILITLLIADPHLPDQIPFLSAITLLVGVGLIDDYRGLSFKVRLIAQVFAVLIMIEYADIKIESLGDLFGFGEIHLGYFTKAFTVFAVVGCINAFNMIDGMDGLLGTLMLVFVSSLGLLAWIANNSIILSYCIIFIAVTLAFLPFNLPIFGRSSAKIFLGDNGSTQFGFAASWLAIDATQGVHHIISASAILWLMAIPVCDAVCIILRRLLKGRPVFEADREHLHHVLMVSGYTNNSILLFIFISALLLSIFGISGWKYFPMREALFLLLFIGLFVVYFWLMSHFCHLMKIDRYCRIKDNTNRRQKRTEEERMLEKTLIIEEKRSGSDRRYSPTLQQLTKFHNGHLSYMIASRLLKKSDFNRYQTEK